MDIKAVLFDYDGVLVNTIEDLYRAWEYSFLENAKVRITKDSFLTLEGNKASEIAEKLTTKYDVDKNLIGKIVEKKEKYYLKNNNFYVYPKILNILNFLLRRKVLIAIVSGAPKVRIKKMIGEDIFNMFNLVIGAEDVVFGKPNPEVYLKALKGLRIQAKEAIVIENAPLGIEAAKNAGIYCVAIESTVKKKHLMEADFIVKDFNSLFKCVSTLFENSL